MKKVKVLIATLAILASAAVSHAANATANATLNYFTPVSITEQNGFSFTITRKSGYSHYGTAVYASDAAWTTRYDASPYTGSTPGCFKVSGEPGQNVQVSVSMPASLTSGALSMDLISNAPGKFEGAVDPTDCTTAVAGTYTANKIDGTTSIAIPAGGNLFYAYKMGSLTQIKINSDSQAAYTGTGTATVDYL